LTKPIKSFSREFKLAAVQRMLAGENVTALASELRIRRKYLYHWRDRFRAGGPEALRGPGRPAGGFPESRPGAEASQPAPSTAATALEALAAAQRRIAELERKIGSQQVELDFFQQALRQVRATRRMNGVPGATASTRSSKR
jgi:transposase-like protein